MSYIKQSLGKEEKIEHLFGYCGLIKAKIILCYVFFIFVAFKILSLTHGWSLLLLIVPIFFHLKFSMMEMGITNKRIILKQGILSINTQEQLLKKIETIDIRQTFLERVFNTATIKITGTGNNVLFLNNIAQPMEVKKSIESLL